MQHQTLNPKPLTTSYNPDAVHDNPEPQWLHQAAAKRGYRAERSALGRGLKVF